MLPGGPRPGRRSRTPPTTSSLNKYVTDHWQQPNASQDPQTRRQHVHPELRPDPRLRRQRHHRPVQPEDRAELPRGAAHRRADQGRRVRRRLRLRRLLPGRLRPGRRRRHLRRRRRPGRRWSPATTSPTSSCRRTPTTPAPATRRTPPASSTSARPRAPSPADGDGLPLPAGARGGRQRRPRQPVHARSIPPPPCTGDDHVIDQSTLTSRAASTSASPAPTRPLCDKRLVVLQNGQNANADFNLMTNFRTDPNGDGRRATPGPATSRSPAGSSAWSSTTSTSSATRSRCGTASRARSAASRSASTPRVDTDARTSTRRTTPNNWRLLTTVDDQPGRHVRGAAAVDRDVQLPDPAGTVPGHVPGQGRRPGHQGAPERRTTTRTC